MAEIPPGNNGTQSSIVTIVAIVILAGLAVVFFSYILPRLQGTEVRQETPPPGVDIEITPPAPQPEAPEPTGGSRY